MGKAVVFIILVVLSLLLAGCGKEAPDEKPLADAAVSGGSKYSQASVSSGVERVKIIAKDGTNLIASYYSGGDELVVLLHMLNKDRHAWDDFAEALNKRGFTVLAPDLRGHGESDLNWMVFKDADFLGMVDDVGDFIDFVIDKKELSKVYVVGASIGANAAIISGAEDSRIDKVVMLSPGNDYHGLKPAGSLLDFGKPALIVYGQLDSASANAARSMADTAKIKNLPVKSIAYRDSRAHGTDMLAEHTKTGDDLALDIMNFLATG